MIPLSFEQTFDRSLLLLSAVGAGSWTISSASTVFPLTAVTATDGFNCSDTSLCLAVLTIVSDDHRLLSSFRGETTETVVKALPSRPGLTALQTTGNAKRTERYAGVALIHVATFRGRIIRCAPANGPSISDSCTVGLHECQCSSCWRNCQRSRSDYPTSDVSYGMHRNGLLLRLFWRSAFAGF